MIPEASPLSRAQRLDDWSELELAMRAALAGKSDDQSASDEQPGSSAEATE